MTDLAIHNLTAGYEKRPAIHHVTTTFKSGSLTAIVGPNGGGKSTLLKAIMGLVKPMSGEVQLPGGHQVAYLPQISEIDRSFPITVFDVAMMGHASTAGFFRAVTPRQRHETLIALEQVGMEAFAARPIAALSVGQFQRVLFARLIVQNAGHYLLDEPFSAIDSRTIADLMNIIKAWHMAGKTVICVLHDLQQVRDYFPEAALLSRELIAHGPAGVVLSDDHLKKAAQLSNAWDAHAHECHIDARPAA